MKVIKTRIDEYGDTVEYTEYADSGYDIVTRDNFSFKLIESLQRPTLARNIAKHLHRLQAHKRYARDSASWQIIVEDICNDLADVSEYAIIKICEKFRLDTTTSFFPDTAKLIKEIKDLDYSLKNIYFKEQFKQQDNQEQVPPNHLPHCQIPLYQTKLPFKSLPIVAFVISASNNQG